MPPIIKVEDQSVLVETSKFPYANWKYPKFNPVQSRIFEYFDKDMNGLIAAMTSAGKAQPDDALVLTPHGYKPIGLLSIGDQVIGGDGKPTKVIGVYPQGVKSIFKITFKDKTFTECCADHLWSVSNRNHKDKWMIKSTKEIASAKPNSLHVPYVGKVEFPERNFVLHPYLLGLILGDGGISHGIRFTTTDKEVLGNIEKYLPKDNRIEHVDKYDYKIVGDEKTKQWNCVAYELSKMGLMGLHAYDKYIPYIYKYSSIEQRIFLLKGLMDSDGGCSSGGSPTFEVTSKELAEDMAFLIRSLGGWTNIRVKNRSTYKYKGEIRNGRTVYRLTVSVNFHPFLSLSTSKSIACFDFKKAEMKRRLKTISLIEEIGDKACRCIKVENDDGLYVTNDFIVTHNTTIAEMVLSHEMRVRGGKGLYLVPMRALAQEKIDEWTASDHHFADKKISICTGDYRLTKERAKELAEADLIIMTSEMLSHRSRNYKSEQNDWLLNVGTCVVDEGHLLTVPGRGDHLEVGLMKFTEINPKVRLFPLSATMPNVEEIAEWISYSLTKRETFCLRSKFRPCALNIHYEKYYDGSRQYDATEEEKVSYALEIIENYPNDKFLVFAHTKRTGELMKNSLRSAGIKAEFHNAGLEKKDRVALEKKFRDKGDLRVLVATPTMAWGVNVPARRVIVLGIHRGLEEVETYNVTQMIGRSGRVGLDPQGDAYILLPESKFDQYKAKLQQPQKIESQLLSKIGDHHKVLAFHLVSEIHHGDIKNIDDVHHWYKRSLAYFQNKALEDIADKTIELLQKCGAVKVENDVYKATNVGTVSSMFYFSPFDVSDLKKNFNDLFFNKYQDDDYRLSMSLGNIDTQRMNIVSRAEKEEMSMYAEKVKKMLGYPSDFDKSWWQAAVKAGFCYYQLLNGFNSGILSSTLRNLQFDYNRLSQVLIALDTMGCGWNRAGWFRGVEQRIANGVPMYLVDLCRIPNIGKVRAKKLYDAGIKTAEEFADMDVAKVKSMLNVKVDIAQEMLQEAQTIALVG